MLRFLSCGHQCVLCWMHVLTENRHHYLWLVIVVEVGLIRQTELCTPLAHVLWKPGLFSVEQLIVKFFVSVQLLSFTAGIGSLMLLKLFFPDCHNSLHVSWWLSLLFPPQSWVPGGLCKVSVMASQGYSADESSADRNVEIWKIKKLIKSLEMARG